jgi:hypothetical protein
MIKEIPASVPDEDDPEREEPAPIVAYVPDMRQRCFIGHGLPRFVDDTKGASPADRAEAARTVYGYSFTALRKSPPQ